uniref:Uncharacterized protein n=1 Tax=Bos indicus x Bos taurus TaxID=30522 RepID=A0A4W2GI77_BOBOX
MTWSLPDGSLISGFHSEESFWEKPARKRRDTGNPPCPASSRRSPHIALRGTWTGSPGRWCCWQCRHTPRRRCTGCSSASGTTRGRGCAPPCARPGSAGRGGAVSASEVGGRAPWELGCIPNRKMGLSLSKQPSLCAKTGLGRTIEAPRQLGLAYLKWKPKSGQQALQLQWSHLMRFWKTCTSVLSFPPICLFPGVCTRNGNSECAK